MWKKISLVSVYFLAIMPFILISNLVSAKQTEALTQTQLLEKVTLYVSKQVNPSNNEQITVTALPLDSRLRIKPCTEDLNFNLAKQARFTRQFPVKVSCNGEKPWKLYVQVAVRESVKAIVSLTTIAKGSMISKDMIGVVLVDKHLQKNRSSLAMNRLLGGRALRNLPAGYQIGERDVCLICKGDAINIIAKSGNMQIKTSGTALENGSFGESIRVKNNSSKRVIKGIIGESKQIHVNL